MLTLQEISDIFERRRLATLEEFKTELLNGVVNFRPTKKRIESNDVLTKKIFVLSDLKFGQALDGYSVSVKEATTEGKTLKSEFMLQLDEKRRLETEEALKSLTEFDRAVLAACISEIAAGNKYVTINTIYRNLTGKVGEVKAEPSKTQHEAIMSSVKKMSALIVTIDYDECIELLHGAKLKAEDLTGYILPCEIIRGTINGKKATVLKLLDKSPLYVLAAAKKQLLTYDARLLDVPKQQNTPMNIALKSYTMRRVQEIKAHKQLTPTIKFTTTFKDCKLTDADNKTKMRARKAMIEFFEHLKKKGEIISFSVAKDGITYDSIKFTFKAKK